MENGSGEKYVLAMYDVRGKQEYIFRSTHIKEIMGASAIIRDIFDDYLYDAAIAVRNRDENYKGEGKQPAIYNYKEHNLNEKFEKNACESRLGEKSNKQYIGEVIYDGGGNFFVLYKNEDVCIEVNKIFTRNVLENTYSLKVLCVYKTIDNFDKYSEDVKELYNRHRVVEARETPCIPAQVLPFTDVDYMTSMPLYKNYVIATDEEKSKIKRKITRESFKKYEKYGKEIERLSKEKIKMDEKLLDNIITEKGKESLLAVIYIDGNNMGAKVQDCINNKNSYEDCINALREFSASIQKDYIDDPRKEIENYFDEKVDDVQGTKKRRFIVYAGDEINFICNVRDAFNIVDRYFKSLNGKVNKEINKKASACAGIAIFHSHAPYSEAYRIAEECCESGKKKIKELKIEAPEFGEANFVDFHYCQGGIGVELETIRNVESEGIISKPWYVSGDDICKLTEKPVTIEQVKALVGILNKFARTNVKGLADSARNSLGGLKMEWARMVAHSEIKDDYSFEKVCEKLDMTEDEVRKLIYDVIIVYDVWFAKEEGGTKDEA